MKHDVVSDKKKKERKKETRSRGEGKEEESVEIITQQRDQIQRPRSLVVKVQPN